MLRCIVSRHKSQHRRRRRIFAGLLLIGLVHTHTHLPGMGPVILRMQSWHKLS